MRIVENRVCQRAIRLADDTAATRHWRPRGRSEIKLVAKRANCHVEGYRIAVTGEIAENLGLLISDWINRQANSRRPVVCECVVGVEVFSGDEVVVWCAV